MAPLSFQRSKSFHAVPNILDTVTVHGVIIREYGSNMCCKPVCSAKNERSVVTLFDPEKVAGRAVKLGVSFFRKAVSQNLVFQVIRLHIADTFIYNVVFLKICIRQIR